MLALLASGATLAKTVKMPGMEHPGQVVGKHGPDSPATKAYKKALTGMIHGMEIPYTGNADTDFVRGMIAHHQGAVDMAKVVLEYGKDRELRALAEGIVKAQETEIAFMTEWKRTHPAK